MSGYVFLFDLDATITRQEILPAVSRKLGVFEKNFSLTKRTMQGEIPFKQSFLDRVELLKKFPVSQVSRLVDEIPVNEKLVEFITNHRQRCYIVTVHLDVWIQEMIKKMGMEDHLFCSRALVRNDYIQDVSDILDKNTVINQMNLPFVAAGDGNHDAEMIQAAEIGIGYGGVHDVSPAVLAVASHVICQEDKLAEFLERLL